MFSWHGWELYEACLNFGHMTCFTNHSMPPKSKSKKPTGPFTLMKGKLAGGRMKQPSYPAHVDMDASSAEEEEELSLKSVMAMLGTMDRRIAHYDQILYGLTSDTASSH